MEPHTAAIKQQRRRARRRRLVGGIVLFSLAVLLRVGLLNRQGLWADELFSLGMATGHSLEHAAEIADPDFGDIVETPSPVPPTAYSQYMQHDPIPAGPVRVTRAVLLSDTSPPTYYLILWGWTRVFGTSDAALRALSAVFALACFPMLWSLARRFGGRGACLPTCALFTFAPMCIWYSTEGRHYSLLWFWTVATMFVSVRLHRDGFRVPWFLAWVALGAAGMLTHYFFAFPLAAATLWLLSHPRRLSWRWPLLGSLLIGLLILPWYLRLPESMANWRVTGTWLNFAPHGFNFVFAWLRLPWSFVAVQTGGELAFFELLNAAAYLTLAILARAMSSRFWFSPSRRLLWLWLAAPLVGLAVFDIWRHTYVVTVPRYALPALPALFLLIGVALSRVPPASRYAVLAMLGIAWLGGLRGLWQTPSRQFEPFREVGRMLAQKTEPGDLVLVHSIPCGVAGVARYMTSQGASPKPDVTVAAWVGQWKRRRVPEDLIALAAGRARIFLVRIHEVGEPAPEEAWLRTHAVLVRRTRLQSAMVLTFAPRESATFFPDRRE